jgi:hypothetical protein
MNHGPLSCKGKIRSWSLDLGLEEGEKTLGREKVIFRFYKRMHWVVCKTQEEEIEREFLNKLERGKRATKMTHFPREIGHKSQENFLFSEC